MAGSKINITVLIFLLPVLLTCNKVIDPGITPAKDHESYNTEVTGLSGLCFSKDNNSLLAVSDKYGIFELNMDGSLKRKLPYNGTNDFEAITINLSNGTIYLADEGQTNLLQLAADEQSASLVAHVDIPGGTANKGIEGLAYGRDTLYAVNQQLPAILIKYSLLSHTEVSRTPLSFAHYLSDVFFDASDNTLWICDSYQKQIFHCTVNGVLIAAQSIDFVAKAEAILVDRAANIAWIGCDQTAALYRIKLTI